MDRNGEKPLRKITLTLYVAGTNARTRFALENIMRLCEEHLKGCHDLEVIDLRENPALAIKDKVVATPMLIKRLPLPIRTFIGNLHDTDKILVALELKSGQAK